jgi:AraC-like DNA-binding protein
MDWRPGYREQSPPAGLLPSVACLWARVVWSETGAVAEVLPDACVDLIWEQGHGIFVAGPDTGPVPSVTPAGTVLAGVRFVPGAAGPALGLPMSELLNQRVDAADLGTAPATELARALPGSLAPAQALQVLARMTGALTAEGPADPVASHAARMLRRPGTRAESVAERLDVSDRQLRRRCRAAVGYGPATLRRVLRFRRFVAWADAGAPGGDLAAAAAALGYADQAHLTRECTRLAGLTPAALLAARQPAHGSDDYGRAGPSGLQERRPYRALPADGRPEVRYRRDDPGNHPGPAIQ